MADPPHPIAAMLRLLISTVFMPALVVLAWWRAEQFDPYTMSFFTKTYIEPTPDMPDEFRIFGWIIIGIGALVLAAMANGLWRKRVVFREIRMAIWMGFLIAAFGGSFFLAANRSESAIAAKERGQ
jgi:hypothetical protein